MILANIIIVVVVVVVHPSGAFVGCHFLIRCTFVCGRSVPVDERWPLLLFSLVNLPRIAFYGHNTIGQSGRPASDSLNYFTNLADTSRIRPDRPASPALYRNWSCETRICIFRIAHWQIVLIKALRPATEMQIN